jgi:hypothetical protein
MTKIQKAIGLNIKALLPLSLFIVSCSSNPITDYSSWCAADQERIETKGVNYRALREGIVESYNEQLSVFLAIPLEELEKNNLGLHFVEDTLYYKNHIHGNAMYELMYPIAASENDLIGEKESCFYRGMDYCFALLVMDLPEGEQEVVLPFLGRD